MHSLIAKVTRPVVDKIAMGFKISDSQIFDGLDLLKRFADVLDFDDRHFVHSMAR
jgi:hypothetical protein